MMKRETEKRENHGSQKSQLGCSQEWEFRFKSLICLNEYREDSPVFQVISPKDELKNFVCLFIFLSQFLLLEIFHFMSNYIANKESLMMCFGGQDILSWLEGGHDLYPSLCLPHCWWADEELEHVSPIANCVFKYKPLSLSAWSFPQIICSLPTYPPKKTPQWNFNWYWSVAF